MAAQIKLVRWSEGTGDIDSVSLLDYTDGINLAYGGWQQTVASGLHPGPVIESLPLRLKGGTIPEFIARLQNAEKKYKQAYWSGDNPTEQYGVYLRVQAPDEPYPRQALVISIDEGMGNSLFFPTVTKGTLLREYTLALMRMPFWEATAPANSYISNVACGGYVTLPAMGDVPTRRGDVPARIYKTSILGNSISTALADAWLGFRTDRHGAAANFQHEWTCTSSGSLGDDTTSGGGYISTTFSTTASMAARVAIELDDVTDHPGDQRGTYNVLLRAKVGSAATRCFVRLADAFSSAETWRKQDRTCIDSSCAMGTNWYLYPVGTVQIPPVPGFVSGDDLRKFALRIEAERTSGAGTLSFDRLYLVPSDEGALYAGGGAVADSSTPMVVYTLSSEARYGWGRVSGGPSRSLVVSPQNYGLPIPVSTANMPYMFFAGQAATVHNRTDTVDVELLIYRRYRAMRGA